MIMRLVVQDNTHKKKRGTFDYSRSEVFGVTQTDK